MYSIIDTHCHLTDEAFAQDAEACVMRAREAGVDHIMLACCEAADMPGILALYQRHPQCFYTSIGIHPENMEADVLAQWHRMTQLYATEYVSRMPLHAVGEIGIDLHWDRSRLADQLLLLEAEWDWALEHDLPVLLHIRDAMPQFLDFLRAYINKESVAQHPERLRGILHCYSGTADEARQALALAHLKLGVGGTLTYKKSTVPEVVRAVGLEHVVLETDAPYLAPVPMRGKRNEPAFTAHTAQYLADLLETDYSQVAAVTTRNAMELLDA